MDVYKCKQCKKVFSSKGNLTKHNKTVPNCNKTIKCTKCQKTFKRKGHLTDHLNRKTPCVPEIGDTTIIGDNEENKCHICSKTLSTKYSLERHLKSCAPKNHGALIQQLQQLTTALQNQQPQPPTQIVNNTYNDNRQINITIIPIGDINLRDIMPVELIKKLLLEHNKDAIPKAIEYIYANPDNPERYNLLVEEKGSGKVYVFGVSKDDPAIKHWHVESLPFITEMVTNQVKGRIYIREDSNVISDDLALMADDEDGVNAYHTIPEAMQFTGKTAADQARVEEILHRVMDLEGCPDDYH